MFLNELIQFDEGVLSSCTNSKFYTAVEIFYTAVLDNGFGSSSAKLQYRINYPSSEYLLFHRDEYQTTELSSTCQKAVLTNLLNSECIYV